MNVLIFKLFVSIAAFAILFHQFDIKFFALISVVKDWWYVAAAALIPLFVCSVISANRWRFFLHLSGIDESVSTLWRLNLISIFEGLLLPGTQGSDAVRIFLIEKRNPTGRGVAGSTVLIERIIGLVLLCLFSLLALPFLQVVPGFYNILCTVILINALVFIVIYLIMSQSLHDSYANFEFKNYMLCKCVGYLIKLHSAIIKFPYARALVPSVYLIVCFQVSLIFVVHLVFIACGYNVSFSTHMAIYPIVAIFSMMPISIAGLGIREGFFVYLYGLFGVPAEISVAASIICFVLMVLVPALLGGVFLLFDCYFYKADSK